MRVPACEESLLACGHVAFHIVTIVSIVPVVTIDTIGTINNSKENHLIT